MTWIRGACMPSTRSTVRRVKGGVADALYSAGFRAAIRSRHGNGECERGMSLTPQQMMKVVNRYIGVAGGYLGDFSYRTHAEFYPEYCDSTSTRTTTPARPGSGSSRSCRHSRPRPSEDPARRDRPLQRGRQPGSGSTAARIGGVDQPAESAPAVGLETPEHTRVWCCALADADELIRSNGATSAVDRIQLRSGHVLALCEATGIEDRETTMNRALKLLRQTHPAWLPAARARTTYRSARGDRDGARFPQPATEQRQRRAPERGAARRTRGALGDQRRTPVFAFLDAKLG